MYSGYIHTHTHTFTHTRGIEEEDRGLGVYAGSFNGGCAAVGQRTLCTRVAC